jgi:HEPN domain-containing protein
MAGLLLMQSGKEKLFMSEKMSYWLELVEYDIATATAMQETGRYLYVGFMCHQVAEKALKAVIARDCAEGEIPPKIHHLLRLAEKANLLSELTEEQKSFLADLNPLNIEARYPEYKQQLMSILTKEKCEEILAETEKFSCWIKEQLSPPSNDTPTP